MPSEDSASPLARVDARVTCPTSFEPLGITVLPSALTASVVRAFTASPGLHFFESTGELSSALNAVPLANAALACPFWAAAPADVELETPACACVLPAWTDACPPACAPACALVSDCAAALTAKSAPATIETPARYMVMRPPQALGLEIGSHYPRIEGCLESPLIPAKPVPIRKVLSFNKLGKRQRSATIEK